jgi:hypothetical protein
MVKPSASPRRQSPSVARVRGRAEKDANKEVECLSEQDRLDASATNSTRPTRRPPIWIAARYGKPTLNVLVAIARTDCKVKGPGVARPAFELFRLSKPLSDARMFANMAMRRRVPDVNVHAWSRLEAWCALW